jgi:nucleotidyltransferase AbiEii toxin of type IV toxin-antitoxin system
MTDEAKTYKTAGAFRSALETRLQHRARAQGTDLQRLRRQVAFDRFLARMFSKGPKAEYPWVLKGGYAMELRTHTARTTKDIDLTLCDGTRLSEGRNERGEQVRAMLQEAAATLFDDFVEFLVGEATEHLEGAPGGGSRYPIQARMDGRDFARFHVDIGIGDEVLEPGRRLAQVRWCGAAVLPGDFGRTAVCGKAACVHVVPRRACQHKNEGPDRHGAVDPRRKTRSRKSRGGGACDVCETGDPRRSERTRPAAARMGACF